VATARIPTYPAGIFYEANWNSVPLSPLPPLWTDISAKWLGKWDTSRGTDFELNRNQTGQLQPVLDNRAGDFDPGNPAGQWSPNVAPYKGLRIRMPFGINELSGDQATAGELTGFPPGLVPPRMNIGSDASAGNLTLAASGSAFQGSQVYQAVLGAGATVGADVLRVVAVPTVPGRAYSFQAQCRIPSGNSTSTQAQILWFSQAGVQVGSVAGTAQTLTSGSSSWVQLSASGTAPQGVFMAWLVVQIAAGTLASTTTWQVDGLQYENSGAPTTWQMPGTLGANLLPRSIATGTASIDPTRDSATNWFSPVVGSVAQATNLTAAPTGHTTAVAWTSPIGTTSSSPCYCAVAPTGGNAIGPAADCVQTTAGLQYTFSLYLMRVSSADATVQVSAAIRWLDQNGNLVAANSGTAVTVVAGSWVRATVTAFAPTGAVWGRPRFAITSPASTTAINTLYATALQFEQAAAASTWVDPGPTFYGFWGFFEQLPQVWRLSGTWGELDAVGVDALAGLAQFDIADPFLMELGALSPNFVFPLNDPIGSSQCADFTGKRQPAPIENSPYGLGSLTLGNGITANTPGSAFLGTLGPVATFANNPAGSGQSVQEAETFVSIHKTTATPGPPPNGNWTRLIHFRCSSAPGAGAAYAFWEALPQTALLATNLSFFAIGVTSSGQAFFSVSGSTGTQCELLGTGANLCDGNWHQVIITCGGTGTITMYVDGAVVAQNFGTGSITLPLTGCTSDVIGASIQIGAGYYRSGVVGDVAIAAELPFAATAAQITNLYTSWRTASSGESTGSRFARLMTWIGYPGAVSIDPGVTQSMGPATDLIGGTALDAAYTIAATENGDAFASSGGVVTFKQRSALYNAQPLFVFGENQALGEWPYEDVQLPTDPLHTYNIWNVTQWSTGQIATAQDAASQQANFPRTAPALTVNTTSFAEAQSAATYQLGRYKVNRMRCKGLLLNAAGIPGLFRVCAQLEKGTRIRVMRRPPWRSTSAPIQFDGFVTNLAWTLDPKTGTATLTVEAAPADLQSYWTLAALHTTLNAQAASGQNQATINALADAAVNKLASSLPQGYQLVFEPGTSRQETMTLAPTGIPSTSPGYSTATLTFTSNFQFTHPASSTVCEPLPQGYTDPTTWDANSVLGVASTTVLGGGGSGTNTVTVGPLADSATNPLGANWNGGDVISLSPGTPNAETATILSVASTVPGYTSCVITLTANLAHSHAVGDTVCDPLPAGVTSPSAVAATTRIAY
jgi:hypothetical protein